MPFFSFTIFNQAIAEKSKWSSISTKPSKQENEKWVKVGLPGDGKIRKAEEQRPKSTKSLLCKWVCMDKLLPEMGSKDDEEMASFLQENGHLLRS